MKHISILAILICTAIFFFIDFYNSNIAEKIILEGKVTEFYEGRRYGIKYEYEYNGKVFNGVKFNIKCDSQIIGKTFKVVILAEKPEISEIEIDCDNY